MFTIYHRALALALVVGSGLLSGCGGGNGPVQPPSAEAVPANAPMAEEKPSTDEM